MKHLVIVLDDVHLFSGEVASVQFSEDGEQVSVTGRFKPAVSPAAALMSQLKGLPSWSAAKAVADAEGVKQPDTSAAHPDLIIDPDDGDDE